jgi:hypothetical protein
MFSSVTFQLFMLNPYQPILQSPLFSGSIFLLFFKALLLHPSKMPRLAMMMALVPLSFSVVNPKVAFPSNRLTCPSFPPSFSFFNLIQSPQVSTWTNLSGPLPYLKVELPYYHHREVLPLEVAISPQASTFFFLLSLLIPYPYRISSRSGHVVIGGKGADGQPLNDVWVSLVVRSLFSPFSSALFPRNLITITNFGPTLIRHPVPSHPPS